MELFGILFILFFSIILHEVSHGVVAAWNGDPTAKVMRRLTLNPLPHVDLLGTVFLPLLLFVTKAPFLFGWAKPVPFNPRYFRRARLGLFTVGLAGPAMNVALAFFFALVLGFADPASALPPFLRYGISINLMLAIFNMIPVPPLDGSRVVGAFFPASWRQVLFALDRWGFFLLLILLSMGLLHKVLIPIYELTESSSIFHISFIKSD
ncbi:MAG: site-2 protease family protein [Candidatus Omnitrophica bacterium]|nr:site-2 protease family protein [Candidatus Omnitrophota bacterium]